MQTTGATPSAAPAGLDLAREAEVGADGTVTRTLVAADHLCGPVGILQGGLVGGVLLAAARAVDTFGAPATAIDVRLRAPTPVGRPVTVAVTPEGAGRWGGSIRDGDRDLATGWVELAGRDPAPHVADLLHLATVPLPPVDPAHVHPAPHCWVCGPANDDGLHAVPAFHDEATVVTPVVFDEVLGDADGRVSPVVVAAVLDCPATWAGTGPRGNEALLAMLAGYHVRFFADAPVMAPLRMVGHRDQVDGRKVTSRGVLLDEDGTVFATAATLTVMVPNPAAV